MWDTFRNRLRQSDCSGMCKLAGALEFGQFNPVLLQTDPVSFRVQVDAESASWLPGRIGIPIHVSPSHTYLTSSNNKVENGARGEFFQQTNGDFCVRERFERRE